MARYTPPLRDMQFVMHELLDAESTLKTLPPYVDTGRELIDQVLEEIPRVREDFGLPPLVTPTSQIVGSMAAFNVMLGRYKIVPREVKDLARGKYGRTPAPLDPKVKDLIIAGEKIIDYRPADDIPPQMDSLRQKLAEEGYPKASTEDVLSYAVFPDVALKFFEANRQKS